MTVAYTIVTANYLAHAKALADSLTSHNPNIAFYVCLIGNKESVPKVSSFPYEIIDTESSKIAGFYDMRNQYNNFELSCALKPSFAEIILIKYKVDILLYLDSDIIVFNKFDLLLDQLQEQSIVLTPHCIEVGNRIDKNQLDLNLLNYGIYNAGFFAIRNSETSFRFLNWWKDKLFTECVKDLSRGKYVDQIWLNLVPIYFNEVVVLKDYGYNMAVWNMSERMISKQDNIYVVNNKIPLIFFHYSGYDVERPEILSKNHPIFSFEERPDVLPLFKEYGDSLERNRVYFFKSLVVEDKIKENPVTEDISLKRRVYNRISRLWPFPG